jgi:hypothetical protein
MSLRTKQAVILLLATVLPFALGGAATLWVVVPAYRRIVFNAAQGETRRLAEQMAWNLSREVVRLERLAAWDEVRRLAQRSTAGTAPAGPTQEQWGILPESSPLIRGALQNLVARELRWWQQTDPDAVELFATDAKGRIIAASRRTTDYHQADERWWQTAFAGGQGRVYVSDVVWDESAKAWTVDIAVPIYADAAPGSRTVGVMKMSVDANRAFHNLRRFTPGTASAALVDAQGKMVVSTAGQRGLPFPRRDRLFRDPVGSVQHGRGDEAALYSWARLPAGEYVDSPGSRVPVLYVVLERSAARTFEPLRNLNRLMVLIAVATILIAVALGWWLAELLVVRQVRTLAEGMRELARGHFSRAAVIAEDLTGRGAARKT